MILKRISLNNFRLHKASEIEFSDNLNFIIGGNGQGKTSILEAIYYLCTTKSLNGSSDSEPVNFNETYFDIKGYFEDLSKHASRVYFDNNQNKKHLFVDDKQFYRASKIIGMFPVVSLTLADHSVTYGSPGERRKFCDQVISQASGAYLKILLEYNKTLRQRSQLLSNMKEHNDPGLMQQFDAWTETLVKTGTELVKHRIDFIERFNGYLNSSYKFIMEDNETPEIIYEFLGTQDKQQIEKVFYKRIAEMRSVELKRATNLVGPHRDDFMFKINDMELRKYGSQGQHKTFQIALRFGEFFYLKESLGRVPVFLMDDIFGELDKYRALKISEYLRKIGQAFITMTDLANFSFLGKQESDKVLNVNNGTVKYE